MDHSLGALLSQKNDEGHEHTIYYLSRTLIGAESRYNPIEKECLALVFAIQKTRHYLVGQTIHVIFRVNPLRILMTKSGSLNLRLVKWVILLSQYDTRFVPQKAVKGQALTDFLAAHPVSENSKLHEDIPYEAFESNMISEDEVWQMFFDGASRIGPKGKIITGVGVVFISPQNHILPQEFSLTTPCSNNVAEYNVLLIGLQITYEMGVCYLEAYDDSKPIVNQVKGEYEVRHENLIPYHHAVTKWLIHLKAFTLVMCLAFKILSQTL